MNNQDFSKIWVIVSFIILIVVGIFAWKYFWEPKIAGDIISVTLTSENWAWGYTFVQIEISGNGDFSYMQKLGDEVKEKFDGKLSEAELKELSTIILSENFFSLPEDFGPTRCADAPTEHLKIIMKTAKGEITHNVKVPGGSICVQNESYQKIIEKIYELIFAKMGEI